MCNFQPREVVGRGSETQLQVVENSPSTTKKMKADEMECWSNLWLYFTSILVALDQDTGILVGMLRTML